MKTREGHSAWDSWMGPLQMLASFSALKREQNNPCHCPHGTWVLVKESDNIWGNKIIIGNGSAKKKTQADTDKRIENDSAE